MHPRKLLEPVNLFFGIINYHKTFDVPFGQILVLLFKPLFFLWRSFPLILPFYVFWPSSLENFKNKFSYNKLVSFYNSPFYWSHLIAHELSFAKEIYVKRIMDLIGKLEVNKKLRILEIGSGVGSYTTHLLNRGEVTTVDISKRSLRLIRTGKGVTAVTSSATMLPFGSANFELAICMDVLEHIPDPKSAVTAIMNVLNHEKGILIANYDIETHEKDHIGKFSKKEFESFLNENYKVRSYKFEVGSIVYVTSNK
jgi:ubiquinone/menaquinone biosynthesis C-methylase UbiE